MESFKKWVIETFFSPLGKVEDDYDDGASDEFNFPEFRK
jgi:hypothetical protein